MYSLVADPVAGLVGCILYGLALIYLIVVLSLSGSQMACRWVCAGVALVLSIAAHAVEIASYTLGALFLSMGLTALAIVCLAYVWLQCLVDFQRHYFGWSVLAPTVQDELHLQVSADGVGHVPFNAAGAHTGTTAAAGFKVIRSDGTRLTSWAAILSSLLLLTQVCNVVALIGRWFYPRPGWVLGVITSALIVVVSIVFSSVGAVTAVKVSRVQKEQHAVPSKMPAYLALLVACLPFITASTAAFFVAAFNHSKVYYYLNLVAVLITSVLLTSTVLLARHNDYGAGAFRPAKQGLEQLGTAAAPAQSRRSDGTRSTRLQHTPTVSTVSSHGDESIKLDIERYYGDEGLAQSDLDKFDQVSPSRADH